MKFKITLFVTILGVSICLGQSFVNPLNNWYQTTVCQSVGNSIERIENFYFGDKVIIDLIEYYKLHIEHEGQLSEYPYLYREELGKVYYRQNDQSDEFLIYDFNLLEGDSVKIGIPALDITLTVVEIDTVELISGEQRRRFQFQSVLGNYPSSVKWIEGIGNLKFPYDPEILLITSNCETELNCFLNSSIPEYAIGNCQLTDINEIETVKTDIIIHPNPTNGVIFLSGINPVQIETIDIYSLSGKKIDTFSGNRVFELNGIESGLYLLQINIKNGENVIKKFAVN